MPNVNLISFLDAAQRTIIAEFAGETESQITVKNPVVVNIVPQYGPDGKPTGQMALQLLPVYFREFQGDKRAPSVFSYNKDAIVSITFEGGFDFRLYGQYEHIFNPPEAAQVTAKSANPEPTPVLKLFDD